MGVVTENIVQELAASGIEIDDDNLPLEENIPTTATNQVSTFSETWGHDDICLRRQAGEQNIKASLANFPQNFIPMSVQLFEHLFPKTYLQEVVLVETNKNLGKEEKPITYGELLRFLGL